MLDLTKVPDVYTPYSLPYGTRSLSFRGSSLSNIRGPYYLTNMNGLQKKKTHMGRPNWFEYLSLPVLGKLLLVLGTEH